MSMNDTELSDLEAKAKAAGGTDERWKIAKGCDYYVEHHTGHVRAKSFNDPVGGPYYHAEFIATANPATVLALIAEVRRLRHEIEELERKIVDLQERQC